jgi:hypothetical protein
LRGDTLALIRGFRYVLGFSDGDSVEATAYGVVRRPVLSLSRRPIRAVRVR